MAELIGQQADLEVCGEAGDAGQALAAVAALKPDLVLMDITLPGKHGLEVIKDIKALHPRLPVLVVSMHDENLYAERALRAGARGYLMKNEGGEKLLQAIRQVLGGAIYVSQALAAKVIDLFSGHQRLAVDTTTALLTDRELEVFEFLGQGLTTREIGQQMRVSPKTVETHRMHIREKMGLRSGPELIKRAVRWVGARELL